MLLKDSVQIVGRTILFSDRDVKTIVRSSGLKSKKTRKIKKRLKLVVENALRFHLDKENERMD